MGGRRSTAAMFRLFPRMLLVAGVGAQCAGPTPLSLNAPNVLSIGDSVSMGPTGYAFYLLDMLQNESGGSLVGSMQHGGGFGWGGQMALLLHPMHHDLFFVYPPPLFKKYHSAPRVSNFLIC